MTASPGLTCDEVRDLAPLFAIGALDADEAAVVREHLAECEDAHAEVQAMGEAVSALGDAVTPVDPPAALKGRLMTAAAADLAEGRHPTTRADGAEVEPEAADAATPASAPIPLDRERARRRRPSIGWIIAAAAVIAVVALVGVNVILNRNVDPAQAYRDGVARALELAALPGSQTAPLAGPDAAVSGLAVIGSDGTVELVARGLAPTSGSQVYTAWTIGANGAAPISLGDFTVGADGRAVTTTKTPGTSPGDTIALTLESGSGHTAPGGPVVAAGETNGGSG